MLPGRWIVLGLVILAAQVNPVRDVPAFRVDPSWPQIPPNWQFGQVASVAVDADDHVWVLQRPGTLGADEKSKAAPPVIEFTAEGKVARASSILAPAGSSGCGARLVTGRLTMHPTRRYPMPIRGVPRSSCSRFTPRACPRTVSST